MAHKTVNANTCEESNDTIAPHILNLSVKENIITWYGDNDRNECQQESYRQCTKQMLKPPSLRTDSHYDSYRHTDNAIYDIGIGIQNTIHDIERDPDNRAAYRS